MIDTSNHIQRVADLNAISTATFNDARHNCDADHAIGHDVLRGHKHVNWDATLTTREIKPCGVRHLS